MGVTEPDDQDELGFGEHFAQSFARGLSVFTVFGPDSAALTVSDVSRATGMTRASARRFLLTLVDLGYMHYDGKLFRLAPKVLTLGYAYLSSMSLPGIAHPHLEELVLQTHESSSISVLDDTDIVYVGRVPTSRIMTVAINVGTRFPAHATSMGRVLLADLDEDAFERYLAKADLQRFTPDTVVDPDQLRTAVQEVRAQGYALVDQQLEQGLRSVAAPVRNRRGRVVAAVNVSSHVSRVTKERIRREFLPLLLRCVAATELDLARGG